MANHKSARKRARQDIKRRENNRQYMSSVRSAIKKFTAAIESGEPKDALQGLFVSAQSALAKAGSKGRLHKNNAARRISRLSTMFAAAEATTGKPAAAATKKKATKKKTPAKKKASAKKKKSTKTKTKTKKKSSKKK